MPRLKVYSDFDGTIARVDVTDHVLERLAAPEWQEIEAAWRAGEIDAAACMRRQIALIEATPGALDACLDEVEIDPAFPDFVRFCEAAAIPLLIVSDGVDYFAQRILRRHRLDHLRVCANQLVESGGFALRHPWQQPDCRARSGVCKCAIVVGKSEVSSDSFTVYVGDGRSDRCVSERVDLLFAKHELASYCRSIGVSHVPFVGFDDVQRTLSQFVQSLHEEYVR
jgi:2-hydroxy-3-keto-5-methylthiopentenyl-1-phosphate phosphatase